MSRLVDYFVVCGLHSETLEKELTTGKVSFTPPILHSFPPKVLSHYPVIDRTSNPFDEAAITTLCMPDGLRFTKNLTDLTQKHIHTFCITKGNGLHLYGTSLTYYELTTDVKILNSFEAFQSKYLENIRIQLHSKQDYSFSRTKDKLYAPKCLCFITPLPIFCPLKVYLEQLYAITVSQTPSELPVASYIFNLLYEVTLPSPGKTLLFKGPLGRFHLRHPSHSELPACDYSFRELFELLGVRNVVRLVTCLFLEHQVLLKSSDLERLSLVAHCARALLWPFSWPHVFVPFLPASQLEFLDAPIPYLMGLRVDKNTQENNMYSDLSQVVSLCTVEVDTGHLLCPEELPSLPDEEHLFLNLSRNVQEHGVKDTHPLHLTPSPPPEFCHPPLFPGKFDLTDRIELLTEIVREPNADKMVKSKSPTLSVDEGAYDLDDDDHSQACWNYVPDKLETKFASAVRETFVGYFVEHFLNYEKFIVMPTQDFQQWQNNREQFLNFDKTAYLSDQPLISKPFFSTFLETSIFSMFVDNKIIAIFQPELCSPALALFDAWILRHRDKSGLANPPRTPGYRINSTSSEGEDETVTDDVGEEIAPPPHNLSISKSTSHSTSSSPSHTHSSPSVGDDFPWLDSKLLQLSSADLVEQCSPEPPVSFMSTRRKSCDMLSSNGHGTVGSKTVRNANLHKKLKQQGISLCFSSYNHAKFVSQLMRETRLRVKHMLGSSRESESLIEENTHIAYLCDLLERIWGHGLKKRESNSPLWGHLMAYAETEGRVEFRHGGGIAAPPHALSCMSSDRRCLHPSLNLTYSPSSSPTPPATTILAGTGEESPRTPLALRSRFPRKKFQSPELRSRVESILHPPPSSLVDDLLVVHNMHELKTDVGRARGWVRLALEKKALSRHLIELLVHDIITSHRYREYAFIRTDEEKEQFIYHLLTLTAREFSCFTSVFLQTTMKYHVLVVAEGKRFGLSTSCLYLNLAGEFQATCRIEIPRGDYDIIFEHENIGRLTCLRLGHDNSGMAPSLYVESVLVHNVTTGQTYRCNCCRWFGKNEEDGSLERFLVAEKVPQTLAKTGTNMSVLAIDSILPACPGRRRVNKTHCEEDTVMRRIMVDLKHTMDKIRTMALSKKCDKMEMLKLIHSETGFIQCMKQVFDAGFRSYKKFTKRLHFWDLLERVDEYFLSDDVTSSELSASNAYHRAGDYSSTTYYCHEHELNCRDLFQKAVTRINSNNTSIGKDEKVMRFLCLALRDHLLRDWLTLVASFSDLPSFYDTKSFLRDPVLFQNLIDTFQLTLSLPIALEPLFIQGL